jgi:ATP-dependent DNA helicase DinG
MRLDKQSSCLLKSSIVPSLFQVAEMSDETVSIKPLREDDISGNILVYSDNLDYAFDIAFEHKDKIDYLLFLDSNKGNIEIIAKPQKKLPSIDDIFNTIQKNNLFEKRDEQIELARQIESVYENSKIGICEAPTGTGKSLAYLVPSILYAKKHQKKVLVSTNTINLQKQLIEKDIPILKKILNFSVKIALGRNNYLCKRKLDSIFSKGNIFLFENDIHKKLKNFSKQTKTGLKGDFLDKENRESDKIWDSIASSSASCAHSKCPYYRNRCFYYKARAELESADLIVANHHIVLSDALLSDAKILPEYSTIVFDEAHNLEKNATNYFTKTAASNEISYLLDKLYTKKKTKESGFLASIDDNQKKLNISRLISNAKDALNNLAENIKLPNAELIDVDKKNINIIKNGVKELIKSLEDIIINLKNLKALFSEEEFIDISSIMQAIEEKIFILSEFIEIDEEENIRWSLSKVKVEFMLLIKRKCKN